MVLKKVQYGTDEFEVYIRSSCWEFKHQQVFKLYWTFAYKPSGYYTHICTKHTFNSRIFIYAEFHKMVIPHRLTTKGIIYSKFEIFDQLVINK